MTIDTLDRDATDVALVPVPEGKDAYALFTAKDTTEADRIITVMRAKADAFMDRMPDITKASGRKEVKSFAYKITRSKTLIDSVGKGIVDELKELPKRVDANRRHIKNALEALADKVSKPVDDWDAAEKERVDSIKADLAELQATIDDPDWTAHTAGILRERLTEVERDFADISVERFGEYVEAAAELKTRAVEKLRERIGAAKTREEEAAELARLRAEAEERAKKDREEQIAREAAEKAKQEAEAKAKADAEAAEQRERDLKLAVERAAEEKRQAEERAAKAEQDAREKAARDAQEAREREEAEQRKREQDRTHRAAINSDILSALVESGISEDVAVRIVALIASHAIPHTSIRY